MTNPTKITSTVEAANTVIGIAAAAVKTVEIVIQAAKLAVDVWTAYDARQRSQA